jgi:hypothetical protein
MGQSLAFPAAGRAKSAESAGERARLRREARDLTDRWRSRLATLRSDARIAANQQDLVRDVTKGRPASDETIIAATVAVVQSASPVSVLQFMRGLCADLMALSRRPMARACLRTTWDDETTAQASADVAQQRAFHAIETGNLADLDRAIERTTHAMWTAGDLLGQLIDAKAAVRARRPRVAGGFS